MKITWIKSAALLATAQYLIHSYFFIRGNDFTNAIVTGFGLMVILWGFAEAIIIWRLSMLEIKFPRQSSPFIWLLIVVNIIHAALALHYFFERQATFDLLTAALLGASLAVKKNLHKSKTIG